MRLGSCIAVEAVAFVVVLGGLAIGASSVMAELRGPGAEPRRDVAVTMRVVPPRQAPPPVAVAPPEIGRAHV